MAIFEFLSENAATIAVLLIVAVILSLALIYTVKQKRKGACSGCQGCSMCSSCSACSSACDGKSCCSAQRGESKYGNKKQDEV